MECYVNCSVISSREEFHRVLARLLDFPEWYGHNLDALHDLLTAVSAPTHLHFYNWECTASFSRGFRKVLTDAEAETPRLHLYFHS